MFFGWFCGFFYYEFVWDFFHWFRRFELVWAFSWQAEFGGT